MKDSEYVVVLDPPEVALNSSTKPSKRFLVVMMGFLGIALGIVIGFIREYVKNTEEEEKKKISQAKSFVIKEITEMYHALCKFLKVILPFK